MVKVMEGPNTSYLNRCELCGMVSQHLMSYYNEDGDVFDMCKKCWYDKSMGYGIFMRHAKQYIRLDEWPAGLGLVVDCVHSRH